MYIAAHWKVFDRTGAEIDALENELHRISGTNVNRTETVNDDRTYDAIFVLKGNVPGNRLADACDFMENNGAYPV